jgi:AcrR family transcriptional regulator
MAYHHGDLGTALLDAAEELVREHGAANWSLREASTRVGVSPSAAYHHFASRDALMQALSVRVVARLGERMQAAASEHGLIAAGSAYVRWALEDPAVTALAFTPEARDPDVVISPHPHDVIEAELDRLVEDGVLSPQSRVGATFLIWPAVHGLATLLADGLIKVEDPHDADRHTERLLGTLLTGLAHESAPPNPWPTLHSVQTDRTVGGR